MSDFEPETPNLYEKMIREWLMQPKAPPEPDRVVYPLKLFHYPDGYSLGAGQKPKMTKRPKKRISTDLDRRTRILD